MRFKRRVRLTNGKKRKKKRRRRSRRNWRNWRKRRRKRRRKREEEENGEEEEKDEEEKEDKENFQFVFNCLSNQKSASFHYEGLLVGIAAVSVNAASCHRCTQWT